MLEILNSFYNLNVKVPKIYIILNLKNIINNHDTQLCSSLNNKPNMRLKQFIPKIIQNTPSYPIPGVKK